MLTPSDQSLRTALRQDTGVDRPASSSDAFDSTELAIGAYYEGSHLSAMAAVAGVALIAWAHWSAELAQPLALWLAGIILVALLRISTSAAYLRGQLKWPASTWARLAFGIPMLMGTVWGLGAFWLMGQGNTEQQLVLICVSIGAVMGSISNAVYWPAHLGFFLPLMSCLAAARVVYPRPESPYMILGALLISVLVALQGRALGARLVRALQLTQENTALVKHLCHRTTELERANHELGELSTTDSLTGLCNRRGWDVRVASEWLRASRTQQAIGFLALDIDHFKQYNDDFGHAAGDVCITVVGTVINQMVREGVDVVARLGGEEFGAMLPGLDRGGLLRVAERIRVQVAAVGHASHSPLQRAVTVSIGASHCHPAADTAAAAMFEQADRALYTAKRSGRDRVCEA